PARAQLPGAGGQGERKHFQGDPPPQRDLFGWVDHAHPPPPALAEDAEVPEAPRALLRGPRRPARRGGPPHRQTDQLQGSYHLPDHGADLGVAADGLPDVGLLAAPPPPAGLAGPPGAQRPPPGGFPGGGLLPRP